MRSASTSYNTCGGDIPSWVNRKLVLLCTLLAVLQSAHAIQRLNTLHGRLSSLGHHTFLYSSLSHLGPNPAHFFCTFAIITSSSLISAFTYHYYLSHYINYSPFCCICATNLLSASFLLGPNFLVVCHGQFLLIGYTAISLLL